MLVLMKQDATPENIRDVKTKIGTLGYRAHEIPGAERTAIGITGNHGPLSPEQFMVLPGVERAIPVTKPYKLVGREARPENSIITIGNARIGGPELAVIAGPCSVESREQILSVAREVKASGAQFLRGGAFKPRSSPYSFQGMKEEGLVLLRGRDR
jgi:3-deoxy-7-phosphoheptulonate synthase